MTGRYAANLSQPGTQRSGEVGAFRLDVLNIYHRQSDKVLNASLLLHSTVHSCTFERCN